MRASILLILDRFLPHTPPQLNNDRYSPVLIFGAFLAIADIQVCRQVLFSSEGDVMKRITVFIKTFKREDVREVFSSVSIQEVTLVASTVSEVKRVMLSGIVGRDILPWVKTDSKIVDDRKGEVIDAISQLTWIAKIDAGKIFITEREHMIRIRSDENAL